MDEIFDRIRATKINEKYLAWTLIFTEILGIITLVWYLKSPLYQKFLKSPPKAYPLSLMSSENRYLISQGDYISSQNTPNLKSVVILRNRDQILTKARVSPSTDGSWNFQIPPSTPQGPTVLTTAVITPDGHIEQIKNYRFRIMPNDVLNFTTPTQTIFEETSTIIEEAIKTAQDPLTPEMATREISAPLTTPITDN